MSGAYRRVGALALFALGVNGIVGVGIFFAPAELAALAGPRGSVLVLVAVSLALLPIALTYAILGARFDQDGGPVTFARAAFGERTAFAIGWLAYVSAVFSTAAVVSGLTSATLPARWTTPASLAVALVLSGVAATGVEISKRAWSAVTVLKLIPLLGLAALVLARAPSLPPSAPAIASTDLGRAALTACFAFQGFEVVPVIAGQARSASRAVPVAVIGSLAFAAILYAVLQLGFVSTVSDHVSSAPLVDTGARVGGPFMARALEIGTSVSALGITFGMIVTTPRYLAAVATDSRWARMSTRGVPLRALALTTLLLCVVLPLAPLRQLFTLSSLSVVLQYAVVALSLVKLVIAKRPGLGFTTWHLAPAGLTILGAAVLLFVPSRAEWASLGVLVLLGVLVRRKLGP